MARSPGGRAPVWVVVAVVLVLNVALYTRTPSRQQLLHLSPRRPSPFASLVQATVPEGGFSRRSFFTFPFPDPPPPEAPPVSPWILLPTLLLYTLLLLGSLGIVSGDYLVPNLSSLAASFGMSDNTAGVTLLAFGNGSPDVFSTYASFTANSGSLAIGELLGAAMFIVCVVVGSMSFIQPFQVHRGPFLRDVGFALAAVALLLLVMRDGELQTWEAASMVGLYAAYVVGVVGGGYVVRWRKRQEGGIKLLGDEEEGMLFDQEEEFDEEHDFTSVSDDNQTSSYGRRRAPSSATSPPQRPISLAPVAPSGGIDLLSPADARPPLRVSTSQLSIRSATSSRHQRTPIRPSAMPLHHSRSRRSSNASASSFDVRRSTFSLLGAVEFRDIVNSLKKDERGEEGMEALKSGLVGGSPFGGGHYHAHSHSHGHGHGHARGRSVSSVQGHRSLAGSASAHPAHSPTDIRHTPAVGTRSVPAPKTALGVGSRSLEINPWDEAGMLSSSVNSGETIRPGHYSPLASPNSPVATPSTAAALNGQAHATSHQVRFPEPPSPQAPAIVLTSTGSKAPSLLLPSPSQRPSKRRRALHIARLTYHTLFPSLQQFGRKSLVGKFLSVLAVPAIFALTVTVAVVDDRNDCNQQSEEGLVDGEGPSKERGEPPSHTGMVAGAMHSRLLDVGENPTEASTPNGHHHDLHAQSHSQPTEDAHRKLAAELGPRLERLQDDESDVEALEDREDTEETEEEMCCEEECADVALEFNKWLLAAQCILGPTLGVLITLPPEDGIAWVPTIAVVSTGVVAAILTVLFVTTGCHPALRLVRCLFGFAISIFWIMALADEVVNVLTVMAELLGLSDAIVGLTVFAIGNSTADLVADLSIATFSPIMAFSACFGGPMLNILLGVGLSGVYATVASGAAYPIQISVSLVTSVISLLLVLAITFVFVPYNDYMITKKWGAFLITFYVASMAINVLAEIFW